MKDVYEKNIKRNILVDKEDEDLLREHSWAINSGYARSTFKIKKKYEKNSKTS